MKFAQHCCSHAIYFSFRGQYLTDHLDGGHYIFNRGQYFIEKGDTFSKEKWPGALFCADHFTSLHRHSV